MWFKNLKIRFKLIALIAFMLVCLLDVGVYSLVQLNTLNISYTEMGTYYTMPVIQMQDILVNVRMLRVNTLKQCFVLDDASAQQSYKTENAQYIASIESKMAAFNSTILNESVRQQFSELSDKFDSYKSIHTTYEDKIASRAFADIDEAYTFQVEQVGKAAIEVDAAAEKLCELKLGFYNTKNAENDVFTASTILISIVLLAVAAVMLMAIGFVISSIIARPLRKLVGAAGQVALGDVDVEMDKPTKDETGALISAFNAIVSNTKVQVEAIGRIAEGDLTVQIEPRCDKDAISISLKRMVEQNNSVFHDIMSSSSQVSTASTSMADGAQALAQGTTEQASAIEQLSQTISGITEQTKLNAENATNASSLTETIRQKAEQGDERMRGMLRAMADINEASARISGVIQVIDDLAFQTNILALNASVEAARAGQHGKGFAVVAEEVKNLANKSAEAAKDTTALIESSIRKAAEGTDIAKETSEALTAIVQGIVEANRLVRGIAASAGSEAVAIDQVNIGISQISEVVQVNSATAQESAAASQQISAQAQMLKELVSQFQLAGQQPPSIGARSAKRIAGGSKRDAMYEEELGFGKY